MSDINYHTYIVHKPFKLVSVLTKNGRPKALRWISFKENDLITLTKDNAGLAERCRVYWRTKPTLPGNVANPMILAVTVNVDGLTKSAVSIDDIATIATHSTIKP